MLTKINRQEATEKFPSLPLRYYDAKKDEEVFNYPKVVGNYILTLPSKSYKGHIKLLCAEIGKLVNNLGTDKLIFLGDTDIPWLRRYKEYHSFEEALQYLLDNKVGKRFNGAIEADLREIPVFIKHLAWLVRTNGVLPYVHFTDPEQTIIGSICQYGNLHISPKTKLADKVLKAAIEMSMFEYIDSNSCFNKFSKRNTFKERTIRV